MSFKYSEVGQLFLSVTGQDVLFRTRADLLVLSFTIVQQMCKPRLVLLQWGPLLFNLYEADTRGKKSWTALDTVPHPFVGIPK